MVVSNLIVIRRRLQHVFVMHEGLGHGSESLAASFHLTPKTPLLHSHMKHEKELLTVADCITFSYTALHYMIRPPNSTKLHCTSFYKPKNKKIASDADAMFNLLFLVETLRRIHVPQATLKKEETGWDEQGFAFSQKDVGATVGHQVLQAHRPQLICNVGQRDHTILAWQSLCSSVAQRGERHHGDKTRPTCTHNATSQQAVAE